MSDRVGGMTVPRKTTKKVSRVVGSKVTPKPRATASTAGRRERAPRIRCGMCDHYAVVTAGGGGLCRKHALAADDAFDCLTDILMGLGLAGVVLED